MKKTISFIICLFMVNCICSAAVIDEIEVISKESMPKGTFIGEYYFLHDSEGELFEISADGMEYRTIETISQMEDYSIIYNNGIYMFINQTQELVPDSELHGAARRNSPIYFYNRDMQLIAKQEFDGYMKFCKFENGYFYFSLADASGYQYDDEKGLFEGSIIMRYYKTTDGTDLMETTYEDTLETNDGKTFKLCNGTQYFFDDNKYLNLKRLDDIKTVKEEPDNKIYSVAETANGLLSYKTQYDDNHEIVARSVSYDMITYIDIPADADMSGVMCDNNYIYFKIIHDDENYYRLPIEIFDNAIKIIYNNEYLSFITPPITESDRTLVPMRFLFEQMGAEVDWINETQTATVAKENEVIAFSIDNTEAVVNNQVKTMDVPARLINDKTMIPLRFLSEELGYTVEWDEETKTVTIK